MYHNNNNNESNSTDEDDYYDSISSSDDDYYQESLSSDDDEEYTEFYIPNTNIHTIDHSSSPPHQQQQRQEEDILPMFTAQGHGIKGLIISILMLSGIIFMFIFNLKIFLSILVLGLSIKTVLKLTHQYNIDYYKWMLKVTDFLLNLCKTAKIILILISPHVWTFIKITSCYCRDKLIEYTYIIKHYMSNKLFTSHNNNVNNAQYDNGIP